MADDKNYSVTQCKQLITEIVVSENGTMHANRVQNRNHLFSFGKCANLIAGWREKNKTNETLISSLN